MEEASRAVSHLERGGGEAARGSWRSPANSSGRARGGGGGRKEPALIPAPATRSQIPQLIFDHLLQTGTVLAWKGSAG